MYLLCQKHSLHSVGVPHPHSQYPIPTYLPKLINFLQIPSPTGAEVEWALELVAMCV